MKLRKLNRNVHRDLGYIFFFLTVIYGLSGVALNHLNDWNPSYVIKNKEINTENPLSKEDLSRKNLIELMEEIAPGEKYKNHYFPDNETLKVFIKDGSIHINLQSGKGFIETSKRRPVLHPSNYLHYNPHKIWTWISDIYAISLIVLAITGLFIIKGKNGITGRGAWLTAIGVVIPVLFLLVYYYKVF